VGLEVGDMVEPSTVIAAGCDAIFDKVSNSSCPLSECGHCTNSIRSASDE
jgi:hypothetical protein